MKGFYRLVNINHVIYDLVIYDLTIYLFIESFF